MFRLLAMFVMGLCAVIVGVQLLRWSENARKNRGRAALQNLFGWASNGAGWLCLLVGVIPVFLGVYALLMFFGLLG